MRDRAGYVGEFGVSLGRVPVRKRRATTIPISHLSQGPSPPAAGGMP